MTLKYTQTKQA